MEKKLIESLENVIDCNDEMRKRLIEMWSFVQTLVDKVKGCCGPGVGDQIPPRPLSKFEIIKELYKIFDMIQNLRNDSDYVRANLRGVWGEFPAYHRVCVGKPYNKRASKYLNKNKEVK